MTTYFISTSGSDAGGDGSIGNPYASMDALKNTLVAGDTVYYRGGVYKNAGYNEPGIWKNPQDVVVKVTDAHGTAEAPITIAAYPGEHVVLQYNGGGAIKITKSDYVRIEGFETAGPGEAVTLADALAHQWDYAVRDANGNMVTDANGEVVVYHRDPGTNVTYPAGAEKPEYYHSTAIAIGSQANHIEIVGNTVHGSPGYGIASLGGADYITIRGNNLYNNAWWGGGNHAISIQNAVSSDTYDGNKIIVEGNTLTDNYTLMISWTLAKTTPVAMVIDEGKGIHFQNDSAAGGFTHGHILVDNNLIVRSGNAGLTENNAERISFVNNTLVDNGYINHFLAEQSQAGSAVAGDFIDPLTGQTVHGFFAAQGLLAGFAVTAGGLRLAGGSDVTVANNLISVSDVTLNVVDATSNIDATSAAFSHNIFAGGTGLFLRTLTDTSALVAGFTEVADPGFVDATGGNYHLALTSPAVDAGAGSFTTLVPTDLAGVARTGNAIDVGAFEMAAVTLNDAPSFDESLQIGSFAMPTGGFTFAIDLALPSDWNAGATVPIAMYGASTAYNSSDFSLTAKSGSGNISGYIRGYAFDTGIPTSTLIGSAHQVSVTWNAATHTVTSYLDGVLQNSQILSASVTALRADQPLLIGTGGNDELTPRFTVNDVQIYDASHTLVGSWTGDGTGLVSTIGGDPIALVQTALNLIDRGTLAIGGTASGAIAGLGDHDQYAVDLVEGQTYTFAMVGTGADNLINTYLRLVDPSGNVIVTDNNGAVNDNSFLTFTVGAGQGGTYHLDASAGGNLTGHYGIAASVGTRAMFDDAMIAGVIQNHSQWGTRGSGTTITYGFRDTSTVTSFSHLTEAEKVAVRAALELYSQITGLVFQEVDTTVDGFTDDATILIANYTNPNDGKGAYAYGPGSSASTSSAGDLWLNTSSVSTTSLPYGSYSFETIMHELGHALGLNHPGPYNAGPGVTITYDANAQFVQDSNQYTVMSYFGASYTGGDLGSRPDTPMLFDIAALQLMYGANMTTRTGDTVYGFHSTAGDLYDFSINTAPAVTIWDAGGNDTLDASGYNQGQIITLVSGEFSDIGGLLHNVSIAFGATVEHAIGGGGDDIVYGNAVANNIQGGDGGDQAFGREGNDSLIGGWGNDTLDGGEGNDMLVGNGANTPGSRFNPTIALHLDGTTSQYAGISGYAALGGATITSPFAFTMEFLVQVDRVPSSDVCMVSYANSQSADAFEIRAFTGGNIKVYYRGVVHDTGVASTAVTDGGEHRVSLVFDRSTSSATFILYIDGVPVGGDPTTHLNAVTASSTAMLSGGTLIFGQEQDSVGGGFSSAQLLPGSIGDIRIFDHVRTAQEIADNAFAPLADPAHTTGLVANWRAAPGNATTMVDVAADPGNPGAHPALTLYGAPSTASFGSWDNDTLDGGAGNDTLDGGVGADSMAGGADDDTYYVDNAGDVVTEAAGAGIDLVMSSITTVLSNNVENLTLTGGAAIDGTGNVLDNHLVGNGAANVLRGGLGTDTLEGGQGDEIYYVNNLADLVVEVSGQGYDLIVATSSYTIAANASVEELRGYYYLTGGLALTGNEISNLIRGTLGDDTIDGGRGADILRGGDGNDTFVRDDLGDNVYETADAGIDTVLASVNTKLTPNVENLTLTGTASITGVGNALANDIYGNAGHNHINGDYGADTMTGGLGNDTFVFAQSLDATNIDEIRDFSNLRGNNDVFRLDGAVFTALDTGLAHRLTAAQFTANDGGVANATSIIIYDTVTGALYYDADADGTAHGRVQFATLSNHAVLTRADFVVV